MESRGTVREYDTEAGWGVIDSPDTPGGCWVHFSAIEAPGYRALAPGEPVSFEWEDADQDGYACRATRVVRGAAGPQAPLESQAYSSTLSLTFDPPEPAPPQ
jgi:CspA family cold shock protein